MLLVEGKLITQLMTQQQSNKTTSTRGKYVYKYQFNLRLTLPRWENIAQN